MFFSAENNRYLQPLARFLGPKFTQNAFAVGAPPRTPGGAYSAPPDSRPLSWISGRGALRGGKGKEGDEKGEGRKEEGGEGNEGECNVAQ